MGSQSRELHLRLHSPLHQYLKSKTMAQTLTDDQKGEIKEAFNFFDKDQDGSIDITELNNVMKSLGKNPTDSELQSLMKGVDSDGDGMINYEEFQDMMAKSMRNTNLKEAFKVFDQDGDGFISKIELKQTMIQLEGRVLTDLELDEMMSEGDIDSDGRISYEEFAKLMEIHIKIQCDPNFKGKSKFHFSLICDS